MKILYILSSYNIYGGTPKKTLDLMRCFGDRSSLYVYGNGGAEFKDLFCETGANIVDGNHGNSVYAHFRSLIRLVDDNEIEIIHTQFSMGETLAFLVKLCRPRVKVVNAFVGPFSAGYFKRKLLSLIYRRVDAFVYVSNYVKNEKQAQFPILRSKRGEIIYNGTEIRTSSNCVAPSPEKIVLFDVAGLVDWKNIRVLIEALNILVNVENITRLHLNVAGDGPERGVLEQLADRYNLSEHVSLLGYQTNIGDLLDVTDIYLHPAYAEGFGIAVAEAMMVGKPLIVSNAGALSELIENGVSGLVVDPHDHKAWAEAIKSLIENPSQAALFAQNAEERAKKLFSVKTFVENYENLYLSLIAGR
ncbi:glycosyltransferase family 4 protein [Halioglobus sp. Uisw_031]|uniref:glycosyltransferase family 4 protein n=1 Tax=Halioglobus sp. Uisw_031 TaxID=3230977 RepID=UPI0039E8CF88